MGVNWLCQLEEVGRPQHPQQETRVVRTALLSAPCTPKTPPHTHAGHYGLQGTCPSLKAQMLQLSAQLQAFPITLSLNKGKVTLMGSNWVLLPTAYETSVNFLAPTSLTIFIYKVET